MSLLCVHVSTLVLYIRALVGAKQTPLLFPTQFKSDFDINEGGYTALSKASGAFKFNGFKW